MSNTILSEADQSTVKHGDWYYDADKQSITYVGKLSRLAWNLVFIVIHHDIDLYTLSYKFPMLEWCTPGCMKRRHKTWFSVKYGLFSNLMVNFRIFCQFLHLSPTEERKRKTNCNLRRSSVEAEMKQQGWAWGFLEKEWNYLQNKSIKRC